MKKETYKKAVDELQQIIDSINGGKGSGNFGHSGRPGKKGGSGKGTGGSSSKKSSGESKINDKDYSKATKAARYAYDSAGSTLTQLEKKAGDASSKGQMDVYDIYEGYRREIESGSLIDSISVLGEHYYSKGKDRKDEVSAAIEDCESYIEMADEISGLPGMKSVGKELKKDLSDMVEAAKDIQKRSK